MQEIITNALFVLLGIPLGLVGAYLTNYERKIYTKYFSIILWILAIVSAVYYTLNLKIALTTTFMFVIILTWKYSTKFFKEEQ